jgi:hypothetical protein
MASFRNFLDSQGGKILAAVLIVGAGIAGFLAIRSVIGPNEGAQIANDRIFIDASTGRPFNVVLKSGLEIPVTAPSGGKTGFPAELCFWTKEGTIREQPFAVLLNQTVGKPPPTFCPDCGRLVVGHNPVPQPGAQPPPTEAEYKPRGRAQDQER